MRAVEVTIQNLIGSGLDPKLENNPYLCFIYTSFQVCRGEQELGDDKDPMPTSLFSLAFFI